MGLTKSMESNWMSKKLFLRMVLNKEEEEAEEDKAKAGMIAGVMVVGVEFFNFIVLI